MAFCLLYGPAVTTVCDHWEDYSPDYTDLCWQSVSAFRYRNVLKVLSSFVIAFLPRSNHLLISWLQSPSAVILEPKKRKSVTISTFPPSICIAVMGPEAMILVFFFYYLVLSRLFKKVLCLILACGQVWNKIPHAVEQLSLRAATTESGAQAPQH